MPEDAQEGLRDGLRDLVPEFAERPWSRLRLCWYSDTPEGDFIVDKHPQIPGLFIATGGSGQYVISIHLLKSTGHVKLTLIQRLQVSPSSWEIYRRLSGKQSIERIKMEMETKNAVWGK